NSKRPPSQNGLGYDPLKDKGKKPMISKPMHRPRTWDASTSHTNHKIMSCHYCGRKGHIAPFCYARNNDRFISSKSRNSYSHSRNSRSTPRYAQTYARNVHSYFKMVNHILIMLDHHLDGFGFRKEHFPFMLTHKDPTNFGDLDPTSNFFV